MNRLYESGFLFTLYRNGHILRVHTIKDLNDLAVLLYGKPLLMRINLVHTEVSSKYSADKITIWEGAGLLFFFIIIIINHCFVCYLVVWYKCTIETIDPMSKDKPVRSIFLVSCNQGIGFYCGFFPFLFLCRWFCLCGQHESSASILSAGMGTETSRDSFE